MVRTKMAITVVFVLLNAINIFLQIYNFTL